MCSCGCSWQSFHFMWVALLCHSTNIHCFCTVRLRPSLSPDNQAEWNRLVERHWPILCYIKLLLQHILLILGHRLSSTHSKAMHEKCLKNISDLVPKHRSLSIQTIAVVMIKFVVWCTGLVKLIAVPFLLRCVAYYFLMHRSGCVSELCVHTNTGHYYFLCLVFQSVVGNVMHTWFFFYLCLKLCRFL